MEGGTATLFFLVNPAPGRPDRVLVILFKVCDYFWYLDFWFWLRLRSRFVTPPPLSRFVSLRLSHNDISFTRIKNTVRAPALPRFRAKLMCQPVCVATHPYGLLLVAAQRCEWYPRRLILIFRERLVPFKFTYARPLWMGLRSPSHRGLPDRCYRSFLFLSNPESQRVPSIDSCCSLRISRVNCDPVVEISYRLSISYKFPFRLFEFSCAEYRWEEGARSRLLG